MRRGRFEERKQNILRLIKDEMYIPMKEKELAIIMQVDSSDRAEFKDALNELLRDNEISISKRGKYTIADKRTIVGTYINNSKGFGFVEIEGADEDLYIPSEYTGGAFHNDTVEVKIIKQGGNGRRTEAAVINIIERGMQELVGTFEKSRNFGFVIPDNPKIGVDIFVPKEHTMGAMDGHKVVVKITNYGSDNRKPEGVVTEIIGHINDPGVDIMSIVRGYELPMEFNSKVLNQAMKTPDEVSEADMAGREDLRELFMVTIDGEDSKDLDDAVSLTMCGEEYQLGVHIADVANYVQENSALDREALKRGTSVYLVDRVIPMLPHKLSNGICSLNEGEDRLAMSCIMNISITGEITDYRIVESVINVNRRMTYNQVMRIFDGDDVERSRCVEETAMLEKMRGLSSILRKKRKERGSIDFDTPECKILLDSTGKPLEIKPYEANEATRLIESFMLAANETVAAHMFWQEMPFLYRVHEAPDMERIQKLSSIVQGFGLVIKGTGDAIHPKEIQKLLTGIEGRPEEGLVTRLALRSMMQAKYSTECFGHFGLACKEYTHFTSPIRRYPDLQIHRILKDEIRGRLNDNRINHYKGILDDVASKASKLERRAQEAERETDKLKKAEYMESRIGEIYDGVISGVTNFGVYVELPNTVEGLVHISKINGDYFYFDEFHMQLIGEATGRKYCLGDEVTIQVNSVDKMMKTIDFVFPE